MLGFVAWLAGSRIGRGLAGALLLLVALGLGLLWVFRLGRDGAIDDAKLRDAAKATADLARVVAVDREISRLPASARRERLRAYAERKQRERSMRDPDGDNADAR